jgi:tRNA threonylcarbamoyladenosine biosynthesis protein TsaE
LHHRYEGGRLPVDHLDLYRLEDAGVLRLQGILDPFEDPSSVTIVDWAERLPAPVPEAAAAVDFEVAGNEARRLRFQVAPPAAGRILAALSSLRPDGRGAR